MLKIALVSVLALGLPYRAYAQGEPQQEMIISSEALHELSVEINEVPFKYAQPMLQTLQHGLRPVPPKLPDAPKPEGKK